VYIIYRMSENLENYSKLLIEYEKVVNELIQLKKEYEENTIIQSMNDMKTVYDSQMLKIEKMNDIIDRINDNNKAIKIMLDIFSRNISNYSRRSESMTRFELKSRIDFIKEIVEDSLKTKTELYYLD